MIRRDDPKLPPGHPLRAVYEAARRPEPDRTRPVDAYGGMSRRFKTKDRTPARKS